MVVCKKKRIMIFVCTEIILLGGTRSYKRNLSLYKSYTKNPQLDPRYIFINSGFNLRPTDIQGASYNQFKRLDLLMEKKRESKYHHSNSYISKNGITNFDL